MKAKAPENMVHTDRKQETKTPESRTHDKTPPPGIGEAERLIQQLKKLNDSLERALKKLMKAFKRNRFVPKRPERK